MEDYKRKYETAINQAKEELKVCGSLNCDAARQIFRFFPELEESEDERVREELLEIVKANQESFYMIMTPHKRERLIAWLEKQGEQKPINLNTISVQKLVNIYRNTDEYDEDGNFKGKPVNCMVRAYKQGIMDIFKTIKQKDMKPAWSEEDENMLQKALSTIRYALSIPVDKDDDPCFAGSSTIDWLKSLKERMKGE